MTPQIEITKPGFYEEMPRPRRKVEALLLSSWSSKEVQQFCPEAAYTEADNEYNRINSKLTEVSVRAKNGYIQSGNEGDWLVKDADGYFTIMPFSAFGATFRPIEESQ